LKADSEASSEALAQLIDTPGATGGFAKVHKVHKPYACARVSSAEKSVGEPLAGGFGQRFAESRHTLRCPTIVAIAHRSDTLMGTRIVGGKGGG